jgi:hypothetical protein
MKVIGRFGEVYGAGGPSLDDVETGNIFRRSE